MAMKRITKRWAFNSFGVILVVLIAIVIGFSMGIRSYYYSAVRQIMSSQAAIVAGQLAKTQESDPENAQQVIEGFAYRDRIELMALDASGKVVITSSGFVPYGEIVMPDYERAVEQSGYGEYQGEDKGENVMAITQILPSSSTGAGGRLLCRAPSGLTHQCGQTNCGVYCFHYAGGDSHPLFCHPLQLLLYKFHRHSGGTGGTDCPKDRPGRF